MRMFMIACHTDGKNIVGFRIIDVDTLEFHDYDYNLVKSVLDRGIEIDGIEVRDGKVVGNNGNFDRYTQLCNGITIGRTPIVITKEYPGKMYDVCNHIGQLVKMKASDIIQFASVEGIANGKIIHNDVFLGCCNKCTLCNSA